ncbi:unnamed protein product [Ilex paraguariensis]|uniref:Protein ENHANCED DISEASE RESISTANCE 2 C-terminal domain-containing protein n=1 Tax=Ilex paraguariensis TaxID=185542 RepID=A0ABC8TKN6_9AQUA
MGACGSKPRGCVGGRSKSRKRSRIVRRERKIHVRSRKLNKVNSSASNDRSYCNPTFQGNVESWFDPATLIESDSDDDFYSIRDDISENGSVSGSLSTIVSPRHSDHITCNGSVPSLPKPGELPCGNSESVQEVDSQVKSGYPENEVKVSGTAVEISTKSMGESSRGNETGMLHNCGLLHNTCLPCLACTAPSSEKRKSISSSTSTTKKKLSLKLSFKWREEQANPTLLSPKALLQRPAAGSQVPYCSIEKKMSDCWSAIVPSTFKVRGQNYLRDKKKDLAPNYAAFSPFGVDVFVSPRKIVHIARFVELPAIDSSGKVPPILVVNLQIPLYPAKIFQNEYDGEGMSYVLYFKLSENYSEDMPLHFQENLRKLIDDEVERVKGFPVDTIAPVRERLKILGRLANVEDIHLSAPERKLLNSYNEKPVLTRPQHEFYLVSVLKTCTLTQLDFPLLSISVIGMISNLTSSSILDVNPSILS